MRDCTWARGNVQGDGRQSEWTAAVDGKCEKARQLRRKSTARQGCSPRESLCCDARLFPAFPTTTNTKAHFATQPTLPPSTDAYNRPENVAQRSFAELLAPQHRPLAEAPAALAPASAARTTDSQHGGSGEPGSDDSRAGAGYASAGRVLWCHVSLLRSSCCIDDELTLVAQVHGCEQSPGRGDCQGGRSEGCKGVGALRVGSFHAHANRIRLERGCPTRAPRHHIRSSRDACAAPRQDARRENQHSIEEDQRIATRRSRMRWLRSSEKWLGRRWSVIKGQQWFDCTTAHDISSLKRLRSLSLTSRGRHLRMFVRA
jgi:hypothetical protein